MDYEKIVEEIYFETIGCPERSSPEFLKNKIKYIILSALQDQCQKNIDSMYEAFNKWENTKSGSADIVDRVLLMVRNDALEPIKEDRDLYQEQKNEIK